MRQGRSVPAAGLPGNRREAGETCSLGCLEGAELRHFDEQSEGGYGRDARNAGEDCEPLGEIGVSSDLLELRPRAVVIMDNLPAHKRQTGDRGRRRSTRC